MAGRPRILTAQLDAEILDLWLGGWTYAKLMRRYFCSKGTIARSLVRERARRGVKRG